MTDLVLAERSDALLRLTVSRPEKANALNRTMREALIDRFLAAADDEGLRMLVITGAGERAFCAGADLSEPSGLDDETWEEMSAALAALPMLTVAAINGPCIGGGMSLALGCDLRLAVPQASFSYPVLRNKLLPGLIDTARLRALLGPARTSALLLGGVKVPAEEALQWGLVDRLVPLETLEDALGEVSEPALHADREQLTAIKRMCRGG